MHATVFIATSLDGYIAREDGGIDWLPMGADGSEDYGYTALMKSVDALVMGRNTFELVLSFGKWPYGTTPVIVLTSHELELPAELPPTVQVMSGGPREIADRLAARGLRHLYVDGGNTVQRFLAAGVITRLIITRIPILLGRGIPLFGELPRELPLQHLRTRSWPSGLVQSEYSVEAGASGDGA